MCSKCVYRVKVANNANIILLLLLGEKTAGDTVLDKAFCSCQNYPRNDDAQNTLYNHNPIVAHIKTA